MAFGIQLVKLTNGTNNDTAPGPSVPVGSTVTFTYLVTNANTPPDALVPLVGVTVRDDSGTPAILADDFNATFVGGDGNGNTFLDLGETFIFTATRIATPLQYTNTATANAVPLGFATPVVDTDVDNHFGGVAPPIGIDIVKLTNGTDNDTAPGAVVPVGSTVTFHYLVTNPGSVPLSSVTVRDDNGTPGNPADDFNATFTGGDTIANGLLDSGETFVFTASRIATAGLYTNVATATGTPPFGFGPPVSATASDNHSGNTPPNDIAGGPFNVEENSATGTFVGTVVGQDPEAQALTYSLTDDAGGRFVINGATGQITVANGSLLDFEQASSHGITVRVTDPGSLSFEEAFVVNIGDVNETVPNDFNADGVSDVLLRHLNGFTSEWKMNAGQIVDSLGIGMPSLAFKFQDTGDFNGDGSADILWRHDSGQVVMWEMNGNQITLNQEVATLSNSWHNEGAGDLNGDGNSDILWRHDNGQVVVWQMDGPNIVSNQSIATPGNDCHVQGLVDTDGDGKSDVLLRHNSGQVVVWKMDGAQIVSNQAIANVGLDWNIAGTGDFNGDGQGDILWRHDSGQVALWEMNGANIVSNQSVGTPSNAWQIQAVGDYNADGNSDVLWRHDVGQVAMWEMDGAQITSNHEVLPQVGNEWTILSHKYDLL